MPRRRDGEGTADDLCGPYPFYSYQYHYQERAPRSLLRVAKMLRAGGRNFIAAHRRAKQPSR